MFYLPLEQASLSQHTHTHIHPHKHSCEEPSPKRAKCDVTAGADLIGKRMAVACSVHAWLPAVLSTGREGRTAVVAMATRSGDVILWSLQVPLPARRYAVHNPGTMPRCMGDVYHV